MRIFNLASEMLQLAICDAICDDGEFQEGARKWLLFYREPSLKEMNDPEIFTYLWVCKILRLNWFNIRQGAKEAAAIGGDNEEDME